MKILLFHRNVKTVVCLSLYVCICVSEQMSRYFLMQKRVAIKFAKPSRCIKNKEKWTFVDLSSVAVFKAEKVDGN